MFLIFTTAFGGSTVPKINLILGLICDQYFSEQLVNNPNFKSLPVILGSDNPQCQTAEVQSRVAKFMLYCNLIAGLLSAVTSPKLGSLSDRYGRTKLMALSMVGMLLNEAIFILAANYPKVVPLQWLFFGFFLEGLGGSFTAAMALTHAYAADCTPPSQRNVVFGYFHSCLFAGIGLGPIVAGYIVKFSGKIITIFYITLACHCFFFVFVIFLVPDSLSKARQLVARQKNSFEEDAGASASASWSSPLLGFWRLSNIFEPLAVLYPKGEGSSSALRRNIVLLAAVDTIMFGVAMGALTVVIIYSEFMFGWNTFETSVFVSIVNCFRVFVLLLFLPIISRVIRGPSSTAIRHRSGSDQLDLSLIRIAILFDLIGYVGYVTARTGPLFVLSGTIASVGAMGSPTLQAALTNHVPTEKSGQVLGAAGLLHALARVVAPTVFNLIYSVTVAKCPQTVFIALSATFGVALVLSLFIRPNGELFPPVQCHLYLNRLSLLGP